MLNLLISFSKQSYEVFLQWKFNLLEFEIKKEKEWKNKSKEDKEKSMRLSLTVANSLITQWMSTSTWFSMERMAKILYI